MENKRKKTKFNFDPDTESYFDEEFDNFAIMSETEFDDDNDVLED